MKKLIIFCSFVCICEALLAQVTMQVNLPAGLTIKPQIWNLTLVNNSNNEMNVKVEMTMTDVHNNQRVLSGSSRMITLTKGAKLLRVNDVMPITYNIGSSGLNVDQNPNGFLPVGNFNVCYQLVNIIKDFPEQIAEECQSVDVEPLSPPQLIIPLDNESTTNGRPMFAWSPPMPVNQGVRLSYDWKLVEVLPSQSPSDAIQQNVPLHSRQYFGLTSMSYPLALPELDTSKLYAWQISARNGLSVIGNSEIWTFRIKAPQSKPAEISGPAEYYTKLQRDEQAGFTTCRGILRIEFQNEENIGQVPVRIFDITNKDRKEVALDSTKYSVRFGQNYLNIDLRENRQMIEKHVYVIEVPGVNNTRWFLKFQFRKPE